MEALKTSLEAPLLTLTACANAPANATDGGKNAFLTLINFDAICDVPEAERQALGGAKGGVEDAMINGAIENAIFDAQKKPCKDGGSISIVINYGGELSAYLQIASIKLKPCQWFVVNGKVDNDSFDKAARFNIENDGWDNYKTISERNEWYKWADKIARTKDNYWFAAAVDVTSWRAVGSADIPNLAYITDPEEFIMRSINKKLLKENFKNFGKYLLNDDACILDTQGKPVCHLKGVDLEKEMVVIEQTEVENMLSEVRTEFIRQFDNNLSNCFASGTNKTPWDCAIWGINRVSDGTCKFCWLMYMVGNGPDAYDYAKEQFKIQYKDILYDFQNIKHRIFIGQTMAKWLRANK